MTLLDVPPISPARRFTPEDLLALDSSDYRMFELVDGQLLEKERDMAAGLITGKLIIEIGIYLRANHLEHFVMPEEFFRCFPHKPDNTRRPDVSVMLHSSVPGGRMPESPIPIRPDIAVEVVSKNDKVWDLEEKLDDYQRAAIPLVVLIVPSSRKARIIQDGRETAVVTEDQQLTLEPVLPGFTVRLGDILPPKNDEVVVLKA